MRRTVYSRGALTAAAGARAPAAVDRILISVGCEPAFIADLLGDLREEYADVASRSGSVSARLWYVREIVRCVPHLARNAVRNGTPAMRTRLAAFSLATIATLCLVTIAWIMRDGPPARLVNNAAFSDGIVVNGVGPVKFSMTVLDAAGHRLKGDEVRYQRLSGIPIPVSSRGVARCTERGDALLRARLGALKTDFLVHCEPIGNVRQAGWGNFMTGDAARALTVDAIGLDGEPVTRIAAKLSVADSTVVTLDGSLLRPVKPGRTHVDMDIGDEALGTSVTVFERLTTLPVLRRDQRWVVVPVHLHPAESVRWPLPTGLFFLAVDTDTSEVPTTRAFASWSSHSDFKLSVDGPIMCMPDPRSGVTNTHCLARDSGATLTIRYAGKGARDAFGLLALDREEQH
ncbi:MAG TPA: hypothetical protein VGD02_06065 [Gemmatimonadaceae bacterium]|jgi:hypothetical protein